LEFSEQRAGTAAPRPSIRLFRVADAPWLGLVAVALLVLVPGAVPGARFQARAGEPALEETR
jgi:hypothetical protein